MLTCVCVHVSVAILTQGPVAGRAFACGPPGRAGPIRRLVQQVWVVGATPLLRAWQDVARTLLLTTTDAGHLLVPMFSRQLGKTCAILVATWPRSEPCKDNFCGLSFLTWNVDLVPEWSRRNNVCLQTITNWIRVLDGRGIHLLHEFCGVVPKQSWYH